MDSFSKSSTSYNISTSSESENEIGNSLQFNTTKMNSNKIFKTSLASNLPSQISNNSLRYFKNRKKIKNQSNKSNTRLKSNYTTSACSLKSLETKKHKSISKNKKTKIFKNKNTTYSSFIDLNQKFTNAFESSSDSDFSDVKYLKIISNNKEINSSTVSKESVQSKSSLSTKNKEQFTINSPKSNKKKVKNLKSKIKSTSSTSFDFSQLDMDTVNFSIEDGYNNELNLDELLSDCSLSDVLLIRDDRSSSRFSPMPQTSNLFSRMKSKSPEPLPLNSSFETDKIPLPQNISNISINMPDLTSDDNENEPNKFSLDIEINEQANVLNNEHIKVKEIESTINKHGIVNTDSENYPKQYLDGLEMNKEEHKLNNECSEMNETGSYLDGVKLNESGSMSNSLKLNETNNSLERACSRCNRSNRLKNDKKSTSQNISGVDKKNKKQSKSKHLREKTITNTSDFLQIKRSFSTNKTKKNHTMNTTNKTEDIGLEYDIDKDNFMVELSNGAIVPAFLSTLKSKEVKKLCACGITSSEIPLSWSQSFHDVLHLHLYKLRFKGHLSDKETINIRENGLCYKIVILCANHYDDENIKKSIKNVDDFVSLEYGISKIGVRSINYLTYLAVLPNFKVIGFLQVEPIQKAYPFTTDEQPLEKTVPVKFGVSKIWVSIKYKNKNVDINLMETFREKEKLQKGDLAFFLDGCQDVQFIQEYTENKNILIYNSSTA